MPSDTFVVGPTLGEKNYPTSYKTRSRSWTNTVGYRTIPKANLPINSYADSRREPSQALQHLRSYLISDGSLVSDQLIGYSDVSSLIQRHDQLSELGRLEGGEATDSALLNEAALKALVKVADAKVNIGVALAEAAKTSDLILNSANRIYRAMRAFRRGNLREVANVLQITPRKFHKNWLEYSYGWMPILSDVKNAAEFLAQQHIGRPQRFVVSGIAKSNFSRVKRTEQPSFSKGSYMVETSIGSKTYKVKIWCEISNPHLSAIQQLGVTNPTLVAWELVPFSFVFDWFCSVGDYLQGLSALHGVTVRKAMESRLREFKGQYYSHAHPYSTSTGRVSGYDFYFNTIGRGYNRSAYSVNPLDLYPPVNRDPFSWRRLASGLALIRVQGSRLSGVRV